MTEAGAEGTEPLTGLIVQARLPGWNLERGLPYTATPPTAGQRRSPYPLGAFLSGLSPVATIFLFDLNYERRRLRGVVQWSGNSLRRWPIP